MRLTKKTTNSITLLLSTTIATPSLAHTETEWSSASLLSGLAHPLTGLDHVFGLLLLGAGIAFFAAHKKGVFKRSFAVLSSIIALLIWSFLHYSGDNFAAYALGFSTTSLLLIVAGMRIAAFATYRTERLKAKI
tara:strand:- start:140 stop:541 length:402 start_codon:yes stop_codon:yes gene_type:complete